VNYRLKLVKFNRIDKILFYIYDTNFLFMKKFLFYTTLIITGVFSSHRIYAVHGLPLVNFSYVVGATGVTVSGGSDVATCGSGPYWMQVEIGCTPGALSGVPPTAMQSTLQGWPCTGGGTTYNQFPWYNSTLNIPNLCSDGCVAESYNNVFIPFTNLCPGQTYYFAAREWVAGSNSPGPFTTTYSFVVPGTFVPLSFNIAASPATYCSPGSSTLSATGVTGGCGTISYSWTPGGSTAASLVVSPGSTTTYSCTVKTPCNTLTKAVTVTVVSALSAAFTPLNTTICQGGTQVFTHTGTAGVNHNWAVSPATGVTITSPTSINPSITFATTGTYVVSHTVTAGSCSNVVTTNITVNNVTSTFTIPSATQCLTGNSFSFNNTGTAGGTHTYSFSPIAGAPAAGSTPNYSGSFTAAGSYVVTHNVTSGGCISTTTMAVTVNPNPSATLTFTNPTCGNNNGVIQVNNTSPGLQTITSITSSAGTVSGQMVTGLGAGSPVITLTNNFGCTFTVSATLANSTGVTNVVLTPNNIICGTGTGSITIGAVTGGTPTYSYNVNGGPYSTNPPVTGLASGTYTIGVKDANGCVFTKTVAITVTPGPTAIAGTSTPAGCGLSNGSYNVTGVTGGTAAYTFSLNSIATSSLSSGLAAGSYTITVKDINGCTFAQPITIGGGVGPTAAVVTTTNASCGMANGSASVTSVTGGVPTYSYSFDGGAFGGAGVGSLSAGPHTVVIKDAGTCTLSVPYNVANNGSPTISLTASTNVLCNGGSTGNFTVNTTGGAGSPTYTLVTPFQTNGTGFFNNLPAGLYTVNSKDIAGCLTTMTINITQPPVLTLSLTSLPVKCFGTSTGTITATGAGGTGGLQYQVNGTGFQASGTFPTMPANTHVVQVKDANGCTASQTVTVTQPTALVLNISTQPANCTAANGVASSTLSGGTPPYTYAWTGPGGSGPNTGGVPSGSYTLTATDSKGCTITGVGVVANTPGGTAAITGSTNITCNGANNGILTANMVTAGTPTYSYSWSGGGQTTSTAVNLAPGTYTCTITDLYGCIATAVGTLTQPAALTAIMNSNNVKCFGTASGTVSASGTGGTGSYTYSWPTLASTLTTVNNVVIGTYTCQIKDANNCVINPTIAVTQPSPVSITSSVTPANCNQSNGSATVTPTGGTPGYTYNWSTGSTLSICPNIPASTPTVIITDANNCTFTLSTTVPNLSGPTISITSFTNVSCFGGNNACATAAGLGGTGTLTYQWNTGQITPTACNFLAGVHTVSVTDQSGCVASTNITITQPPVLTVSITPSNPLCFGAINGFGSATAFGGTPTYTYNWTGGGGSGATSTPLGAGSYAINVTDAKGCTATATMSLVNPPAMSASITSTNVSCFGTCNGAATATTTNNIGIVTYNWIGGASPVTAQSISGLCAGVYTVTATDQNTCTASTQVIITQPTQVTANISSSSSVTCNGGNNGSAQVTPGGGTGAYTYTWTGAAAGSSGNANNLPAGTYTVTVADVKGCTAVTQVTILQPAPLATTLTTTNPTCNGLANGTGTVAFSGGAGLPAFLWQPGLQSGNIVNNLPAGNQTVTITYNGSCTTNLTFTLTQPPVLTAVVSATNSNCGQSNGAATATISGGTGPYTQIWSTSNTATNTANPNILAGAHTFTVTDFKGCKAQATAIVNDIAGPTVVITSTTAVKCFGGNDGTAVATITGGIPTYTIQWDNGATGLNVTNFPAGSHNITVTDGANCVGSAAFVTTQPTQLVSAITSFSNVTCFGLTNGQATIQANGGTGAYGYTWTPGPQTSAVMINVGANTYTCNVKDANNCTTSQVVTITEPQAIVMSASSFSNISCFGGSNGQISTSVQGGTPGYTYNWSPAQPNSGVLGGLSAGGYSLTVTDTRTCSITANFTILEPAVLTSNYTSTPAKCGVFNGSATVNVGGGTPTYTLNWNIGAQQGVTATNMPPGSNWTCVITDSKGCTITQTVNVADAQGPSLPNITFTEPTCFGGQNGSMVVNYTGGTPSYTIAWSSPINPATQVTSALSQTVTSVGAGTYSVTVTDNNGCSVGNSKTVTQPNPLLLIPSLNQTICYGQTSQISAVGSGGTPAYTYTWSPAFNNTGGPNTTPSLTTTTQYNVNMTDGNGCAAAPKVITITVTPPLNITAASYTVCHNDLVTLTPTMTTNGNGGPYTYNWSTGGSAGTETVTAINTLVTPKTYTYGVIANDNCSPLASTVFTVLVNPLPTATIVATPTAGCAPLSVNVSAISDPANTFLWSDLGTQNGQSFFVTLKDSGKYSVSVRVTSPEGCHNTFTEVDLITVYPKPHASFTANPQITSILDPTINFFNTTTGAVSYLWDFGDPAALNGMNNATTFDASHSYSYVSPYNVNLVATSIHGCVDVALLTVEITPDFALYVPNTFTPDGNNTNDFFQPMGVGINEDNYRMDIFDRWGENIFTSNNFRKGWDGSVKGSGKLAEQGVYVYRLMVFDLQGNKHPFVGHVTVLREN
jgi:gliding motility-associated-like protein